jgi:hypothetical protein
MNAGMLFGTQATKLERNEFKIMKGLEHILNSKGQSTKIFVLLKNPLLFSKILIDLSIATNLRNDKNHKMFAVRILKRNKTNNIKSHHIHSLMFYIHFLFSFF